MYFPLQQNSRSCLPLPAIIRRSIIFWRWSHAIPCLIIFLHRMQGFIRKLKTLSTSTRQYSSNSYLGLFGRIGCREECWQFQGLVEVIEYFTTSSDHFRMSHCFWREPSGIFCTFISEGRMFPMLKRLDLTSHKGEDHMISSNSFVFEIGNGAKNALDLFATGSRTWPVCLYLRGSSNSFWKWGFEVPDMKLETFPLGSFTCWIIS